MTKMYKSLKKEDGTYSCFGFLRQGWSLANPARFLSALHRRLPETSLLQSMGLLLDYYACLFRYGAIVADYFEYEFWKKRACVRKEYITMMMNKKIKRVFNHEPTGVFRNKLLFNEKFAEFRNLRCFDFGKGSKDDFLSFVRACGGDIIAKPLTGYSGHGIHKPDVSTPELAGACYDKLKASGEFFCEETFRQTGILHDVNPSSVNTIRIYTLNDLGEIVIPFAGIRFGGSAACVDNIHANGMCCEVDLTSGIVIGRGFNLSGNRFLRHPVSGLMLIGIQIPRWPEVLDSVRRAALVYPNQGHIAWDVAVGDDKVSIIEGNDGGNFDLPQVCTQCGCKALYANAIARKRRHAPPQRRAGE